MRPFWGCGIKPPDVRLCVLARRGAFLPLRGGPGSHSWNCLCTYYISRAGASQTSTGVRHQDDKFTLQLVSKGARHVLAGRSTSEIEVLFKDGTHYARDGVAVCGATERDLCLGRSTSGKLSMNGLGEDQIRMRFRPSAHIRPFRRDHPDFVLLQPSRSRIAVV